MYLPIKSMNRTKRFMAIMITALLLFHCGLLADYRVAVASDLTNNASIFPVVGTGNTGSNYTAATADKVQLGRIFGLTIEEVIPVVTIVGAEGITSFSSGQGMNESNDWRC